MRNTVYCMVSTEEQADGILTKLRNDKFPASDISVVLPDHKDTKNISMKEDAIRGAETGGIVGAVIGWLAGISAITIPGVGAFLIAGPLIAAFGGAVAGGAVGGLAGGTGAVHPLGLPKDVSRRIEEKLRDGDILISVSADDSATHDAAVRIFQSEGANDIYYHDQQSAA